MEDEASAAQLEVDPNEINFHEEVPVSQDYNDIAHIHHNERLVFLTIFRRLSNRDFMTLLKLFALYSNSVLSYIGTIKWTSFSVDF